MNAPSSSSALCVEKSRLTKCKSYFHALGISEELSSKEFSLSRVTSLLFAPSLGILSFYGFWDVYVHHHVHTFIPNGTLRVATMDEPVLFVSTFVCMGVSFVFSLYLFFRDETL